MARTIYDVSPSGSEWVVKQRGAGILITTATKEDAVRRGQAIAKANQPSQLVVHKADGTFDYEYTYGDDPFPPPG